MTKNEEMIDHFNKDKLLIQLSHLIETFLRTYVDSADRQ